MTRSCLGAGGEEALALTAAGVKWEAAPGVTSAIAAPAYAGIPVTHRGVSSGVVVVTGSEGPAGEAPGVDWDWAASFKGTVVVLMAWYRLPEIVEALISRGIPGERPSAVIEWGTTNHQQVVTGRLCEIVSLARSAGLAPPSTLVVGDTVSLRRELGWFDRRPLYGKRVVVTRARSQSSRLAELLESHGAETVQVPTIRVVPVTETAALDRAIGRIDEYDWITFSSPNGVRGFRSRLTAMGLDSRALFGVRVAVVGPATAEAVSKIGIQADLSPQEYTSSALAAEFAKTGVKNGKALCLRSDIGRETLPEGLRKLGLEVDEAVAYRTEMAADSSRSARETYDVTGVGVDATTFTSSSTVKNLARLLDEELDGVNRSVVACIGPVTARTAREYGIRVDVVAREQSAEGLAASLVDHFAVEGVQ